MRDKVESMPINETHDPNHVGLCRKISVTVNLSDPNDYDGGDLWLTKHPQDSSINELETFTNPNFRDKGAVVVFPSWVRHRVTPVTRGTRYSAVVGLTDHLLDNRYLAVLAGNDTHMYKIKFYRQYIV